MKSRGIALGASVIALTLTGGGQALAAGVGDLNTPAVPQSAGHVEGTLTGPAGTLGVEGNVKVPSVSPPSGNRHGGHVKPPASPDATVEANRRSGADRSEALFAWDGRGPSLYVDHTRKGTAEVESQSKGSGHSAATATSVTARPRHGAAGHRLHAMKDQAGRGAERSRDNAGGALAPATNHHRGLATLRSIGREVGNPVALSLAGWLTLLFGGLCLGAGQLARRRRRFE
jgi:hypothetical protein